MPTSLTQEQISERFKQRQKQFADAVGTRLKPNLPLTIESYADLSDRCALVVTAFLETVFSEDKDE
ncbi:hypothetical protein ACFLVJ_02130 [Chloroflexota bacterium]